MVKLLGHFVCCMVELLTDLVCGMVQSLTALVRCMVSIQVWSVCIAKSEIKLVLACIGVCNVQNRAA